MYLSFDQIEYRCLVDITHGDGDGLAVSKRIQMIVGDRDGHIISTCLIKASVQLRLAVPSVLSTRVAPVGSPVAV